MAESSFVRRLLASRWFDPGAAIVVTAASLAELFARPDLMHSPRTAAFVMLGGASLAFRRSDPRAAGACILAGSLLMAPVSVPDGNAYVTSVLIAVPPVVAYSCGAHAPRGRGLVGVGLLVVGLQIGAGFQDFPNVEIYLSTFGPWWVGLQVRRRRRLVAELTERTAQLEAEQDTFTRLAVRRERARIARELHDIVAHHLAVIVIQAGAGRMASPGQVDRADERFTNIREAGAEALAEMARLIDIIDADTRIGISGLGKLRSLLDEARARGVRVEFTPVPKDVRLPAEMEDGAYRVVREGLTNAIKHAPGAEVAVRLAVRDHELDIEVRDTGSTASSALRTTGSGLGLTGMQERVESLGGSLDAGPRRDGGWRLCARLPLPAEALVPSE